MLVLLKYRVFFLAAFSSFNDNLEFAGFARLGKRTEGALRGEEKRDCACA